MYVAHDPDAEIHRHRAVVHVTPDEVVVHATFGHACEAQRIDLVHTILGVCHCRQKRLRHAGC